jgi:hypothetical protein
MFGDKYNITPEFSVNAGIRFLLFSYLGPHDVYNYVAGSPRTTSSGTDTLRYGIGKKYQDLFRPGDPRGHALQFIK